jgi:allantoinase
MSGLPGYFDYPHRRPGLDHDRFDMRYLRHAAPARLPNGAKVALWVTVHVEFFPMDMGRQPFLAPGGLERPYPDYWNFTTRDYGNRVGIFRVMRSLEEAGVKATAAVNSEVAARYPLLIEEIVRRGWEVMASGVDMGTLHHGTLALEDERALVRKSVSTLRQVAGGPVTGWHSPAFSESANSLDLVAGEGIAYVADWINDDMPFPMRTKAGPLVAMPLTYELSDRRILFQQHQALHEFEHQVLAAFDCLKGEAETQGGRILSLRLSSAHIARRASRPERTPERPVQRMSEESPYHDDVVPRGALALSLSALLVPVAGSLLVPEGLGDAGTLLWLAAVTIGQGFSYADAVAEVSAEPLRTATVTDTGWELTEERNRLQPGEPARFSEPGARYGRIGQFALVITLVLGTAGLPHVMNRYFTSPTGRAARLTTVWVLGLAGIFYSLAVLLGTAARALIPAAPEEHAWLQELTVDGPQFC